MTRLRAALLALLLSQATGVARAQSYEIVHAFGRGTGGPFGTLLRTSDGVLYGTTFRGGRYGLGSVFSLTPPVYPADDWTFTELHAFSGTDGATPTAGLALGSDGLLWGTATEGGKFARGTVFQMTREGALTTMYSFNVSDGQYPVGGLTRSADGSFAGTTESGGAIGNGTIFRIDASGTLTTLHDFDGTDGDRPDSVLLLTADGYLFGTTTSGGVNGYGTVYQIDPNGAFTTLHSFLDSNGTSPAGGLVTGDDGFFYGMTSDTVFRMDRSGNVTTLYEFANGVASAPRGELVQTASNVFRGTTSGGGSADEGTIFQIDAAGEFVVLHSFHGGDGSVPVCALTIGSDGSLYGATSTGGTGSLGTVFRLDEGNTLTTLFGFGRTDGAEPAAELIQASDGNLYGTTAKGGLQNRGSFFRLDLAANATLLHSVTFGEGQEPRAGLMEATDGKLYGTISFGGQYGQGSIVRLDLNGDLTTLYSLPFDGSQGRDLEATLWQASDGKLYGTTIGGGPTNNGTIFRVDTSGVFESLHTFSGADGNWPSALIQATDGSLYGTTNGGGTGGLGTVFRIDGNAAFESLHSFVGPEGVRPRASLVQASDGNFYGTASEGGTPANTGTIYVMSSDNSVVSVHDFVESEGVTPVAPLIQASGGNLYGSAGTSGPGGYGTLFRSTTAGSLTTLYGFHYDGDGEGTAAGLLEASDGNFYGTAAGSGTGPYGYPLNNGVAFRLVMSPVSPTIQSIFPDSGRALGATSVTVSGLDFQPGASASFGGVPADSVASPDFMTVLASSPALEPGTLNDVVVTNPDASTATLAAAWFADFLDVPTGNPFHDAVEEVFRAGITAGCGSGNYCPSAPVTRAQIAVFLLKAEHGSFHAPPACQGVFPDVACPGGFAVDWIEQLYAEGITGGCGSGDYCPAVAVTRAQMAVFLLKTSLGTGYVPPTVPQIFDDVPPGAFAADWINDLSDRGISGGCSGFPPLYCPNAPNTRGQMAVFLTKAFNLQ